MDTLLLVSILVTTYISQVNGLVACRTPSGTDGRCMVIDKCPSLSALLNKPYKTSQDLAFLRKSHCGFIQNTPKGCCPMPTVTIQPTPESKCYTPYGKQGKCISIHSCPHLSALLQQPVSYTVQTYIRNSRCNGPQQNSVCCAADTTAIGPDVQLPSVCTPSVYPPDPRSECCGLNGGNSNKIFGGNATGIDQYPWVVIIEYRSVSQIKLLCGGVLISQRYVLTAGHCVKGRVLNQGIPINVRLGEYDTSNPGPDCIQADGGGEDCTPGALMVPIEKITPHPQYDPNDSLQRHDIALIRLNQLAPYTDFIRPICLPTTDITTSATSETRLFAAGWGAVDSATSSSNIMLHVDLPLVPSRKCNEIYSQPRFNRPLWRGQICAGGETGRDTCSGDSGGPLMYENGRFNEVIGIVSFGPTPCGQRNIPGVYTKVYEYSPWIRSQIEP